MNDTKCKTDPRAPHGFDRNASHSADRYVCECEHWVPPAPTGWQPIETAPTDDTLFLAGWTDGRMAVMCGRILVAQKARKEPTPAHLVFTCTHWMPLPEPPETELAHNAQGERRTE